MSASKFVGRLPLLLLGVAGALALSACGHRADVWDAPVATQVDAFGLKSAVAIVDDAAHRVLVLSGTADQGLERTFAPVGHHVVRASASPDRSRLFVLAAGDVPRRSERDEQPSLTVLDAGSDPRAGVVARRYPLTAPLSGLSVDPRGEWLAVFAGAPTRGGGGSSFVENPNEIVLVDLVSPDGTRPITRTIRSFGGRPQRVTFSPPLSLPGGARRLLVVETEQDVSLIDLAHVRDLRPRPEITVRLTSGVSARAIVPAAVVFDEGDPAKGRSARVGVRPANDSNVVSLELVAVPPPIGDGLNDFTPKVNLTDVGGTPSDLAFVRTDGGIRLAALVPSTSQAVLVDAETSVTTPVTLPAPYRRLSLITDVVSRGDAGAPSDVALLWDAGTAGTGVAYWSLGKTSGQPYRSIDVVAIAGNVAAVTDVPSPNTRLKVLETYTRDAFFVLDLAKRTASPLTTGGSATLSVSPDGARVWAYQPASTQLASVDFENIHPVPLVTDRPIHSVFDIARPDGGRALVALHAKGGIGATVFDARSPDTATSRLYSGLALEGL